MVKATLKPVEDGTMVGRGVRCRLERCGKIETLTLGKSSQEETVDSRSMPDRPWYRGSMSRAIVIYEPE